MAERKRAAKKSAAKKPRFSAEEKAAMREALKDAEGEKAVLKKIAEMPKPDKTMAKKIHGLVRKNAPQLTPRTWYGMPAYSKDDKVVLFFKAASKFKSRYATLGFSDQANLDKGAMWPTDFALTKLTPAEEKKIATLVKKAVR